MKADSFFFFFTLFENTYIYIFPRTSRIRSGSRAGMLHFQACCSRSKNNFHSVLPNDSTLVGWFALWLWVKEKCGKKSRAEEKWMSCCSCDSAPSSSSSVFCHDGLRLILTHTRKPDLNHSYWHWEDATLSHEPILSDFKHQSERRPDSLWQRGERWRSILSKRIISILRKDAVSRVIIPVCFAPVRDLFCFVSGGNSLRLGAVCWKWALNTLMHLVALSRLLFPSV